MSRRTGIETTATVALALVLAAACTGGASKPEAKTTTTPASVAVTPTRDVTIQPALPPTNGSAASAPLEVSIRPSTNGNLGVNFVEHGVGKTAERWEAAGWNAVTVASMLTGAPLGNREIRFTVSGRLDEQSTGALMTIAVIALLRGDQLEPDITATGTINPDGTIGPVSGVPEKVAAAVRAHKARMLVPTGERSTPDSSGKLVDVVAAGPKVGIRVVETPDVYDAYKLFTGKTLPQLPASTSTQLDRHAYDKLHAKVESWTAKFVSARSDFRSLAPSVQQDLNPYATAAQRQEQQAQKLTDAGLHAGAFSATVNAAALMRAIAQTGQSLPILLTQGVQAFVNKIAAGSSIQSEMSGLVDTLSTFSPKTVSDASALLAAYGSAIDAVILSQFARHLFDAKNASGQQDLSRVAEGAVYYELAGSLVEAAGELLSVGQGLGGPGLGTNVDASKIAGAFRSAAKANLAAFESEVIAPRAVAMHVSIGAASDALAQADTVYALARTGDRVLESLPTYLGKHSTSGYADLSGAVSLYVRTTALDAKYFSLGVVDPTTLQLVRVANPGAFTSVMQRAQAGLAANLAFLRSKHVNPTIVAADNEIAGLDQNGDVSDKFDALGDYWDGYVNSRVLAYLGGFATLSS